MTTNTPRFPYLTDAEVGDTPLVRAIRERRGGELLHLDRQLLYSPALAAGWNTFLGAVRTGLGVDAKLREIAICTVAVINGADYEFVQHSPLLLATGATRQQVDALRGVIDELPNERLFDAAERATIRLAVHMTRSVDVPDDVFASLSEFLSPAHTVELVGVIAAYNMVSRFLVALAVVPESKLE